MENKITEQEKITTQPLAQTTSNYGIILFPYEEISNEGHEQRRKFIKAQESKTLFEKWSNIINQCGFEYLVDLLMIAFFYLLILGNLVFAVYSIFLSMKHFYDKNENDTAVLRISEHIFLSLLPIFIAFGFFTYYKNTTQNSLIGDSFSRDNDDSSTRTMNLTKTLFLSSIISYVMIKVIELIFSPADPKADFDFWKIIISILLLSILMIYFILLSKKK